ncbi:MAG: Fmu (Sun) domain-containing protein [Flavitalea sp.]
MKFYSHLNTAVHILEQYDAKMPFHHFIREYLKTDRKYGSRDRKNISRLCYAALRTGNAFPKWSFENRIRAGLFLCTHFSDPVTEQLLDDYNEVIQKSMVDKWNIINGAYQDEMNNGSQEIPPISILFPVPVSEISKAVNPEKYLYSFFIQPDLFLRIRPGMDEIVKKKLVAADLRFDLLQPSAVRLPISTRLDEIFAPERQVVIQDYSSQLTGDMLRKIETPVKKVWDACAASGGKSILAYDILGKIDLTVTDIRATMIHNLTKRFEEAGISDFTSAVYDLTSDAHLPVNEEQDLIIADVPCSGSGTWSRTPEQLQQTDLKAIEGYQNLQRRILTNLIPAIKPGGYLLLITCSVFRKENEENSEFVSSRLKLKKIAEQIIPGYDEAADTMFTALFQKPFNS